MDRTAETRNEPRRRARRRRNDQAVAAEPRSISTPPDLRARRERLLDEGLEETFPASDPVAVVRVT